MCKLLLLCCFTIWLGLTYGYSRFRNEIPNGYNVRHPCGTGVWDAVGHMSPGYTMRKNAFGQDVRNMVRGGPFDWSKVCNLDSDGDGITNGAELGDPTCRWKPGDPSPGAVRGHPGLCEPDRQQCTSGITFNQCPNPFAGQSNLAPRKRVPEGANGHPQTNKRNEPGFRPRVPQFNNVQQPGRFDTASQWRNPAGMSIFGGAAGQSPVQQQSFGFQPSRVGSQFGGPSRFPGAGGFPGSSFTVGPTGFNSGMHQGMSSGGPGMSARRPSGFGGMGMGGPSGMGGGMQTSGMGGPSGMGMSHSMGMGGMGMATGGMQMSPMGGMQSGMQGMGSMGGSGGMGQGGFGQPSPPFWMRRQQFQRF